jgi:transposase
VVHSGRHEAGSGYLSAPYRRIVAHRGKQRAIVALEHSTLTAVWHLLTNNVDYHDRGPDHFTRRDPARVL